MTSLPTDSSDADRTIYTRAFWIAYTANLLLTTGNALTFRFAEFVQLLGGTETLTGQVVRAGLIASLVVRLILGQAIDGLGVRRVWFASSVLFILGCLLFVMNDRLGPMIYVARVLFTAGMSSMFACSIYHVQSHVPPYRRTEIIGSLGTSGFIGMIAGTQLGDLLFYTVTNERVLFAVLFWITVALGLAYLVLILIVTRGESSRTPVLSPPIYRLMFRYWPGPPVLVALAMGAGFTITTVFLTRQATANGLHGIGTFFAAYATTGFIFRWVSRSWSASIGRHRVILLGLAGHVIGYLLLIPVKSEWGFVLPAILHGFGHAMLFPCVVSLGAGAFPQEYRGTGTTVILAFVDLGTMISAPLLGRLIEHQGFTRTYLVMTGLTLATAVIYGVLRFHATDSDGMPEIDEEIVMEAVPGPEPAVVSLSSSGVTPVAPSEPEAATCRRA